MRKCLWYQYGISVFWSLYNMLSNLFSMTKSLLPSLRSLRFDFVWLSAAVRFLTRTFRNVFYVRVWKRHVRLWRSQRSRTNGRLRRLSVRRKLEDAWWCQSHVHCRRWRRGHAPGTQTEPQLEAATSAGVILPETGQFLLLCSIQLCQQLQRCRQTRARVQVFDAFYFRSMETVCRERHIY